MAFLESVKAPKSFTNMPAYVTGVVSELRSKFTWQDGMNRNTLATTTSSAGNYWDTPLSGVNPIPTEYLSQLPDKWPYTAYGMPRKTASWALTHPKETGKTVAWVFHSMLFNPRPLHTPKSHTGEEAYQPLLDDWTRAFMYTTTRYTPGPTTAAVTTSATKEGTLREASSHVEESKSMGNVGMGGAGEGGTETKTESPGSRESRAGELLAELKSMLAKMGEG